ncbi:MAG: MDR family MFS transporter [Pseudonocardiaceae bacterium]
MTRSIAAQPPITRVGEQARLPRSAAPALGWGLSLAALIVGMFMSVLDTSIVNVAIPTMQNEFGTTAQDIQWISTAYTLCLGVVVPASAWLGDRLCMKRMYVIALVGFSVASALCGLAWDLNSMIVFRIVQAIPGGVLPVICLTMVYKIVPREKIGLAMGMYGLGIVVAPAIGPTLGGYLVEYVSWRLIFDINVPVGLLGALAAYFVLPKLPSVRTPRFDMPGFLAVAAGLFALLLAFSEGTDWGWSSYRVLMLIAGGLLCLALFVVIELEADAPLLDVRIFRYWPFLNSLLLIVVLTVGLFSTVYYVPVFLQEGQGMEAFDAGLLLLPQALVMLVLMPLAGRLYDRFGPRWLAVSGLAITGIATLLLAGINPDMTRSEVIWWLMLRAFGLGLSIMPIMTGGLSVLPPAAVNHGSAFNNLLQRVSGALGLAVLTALATVTQSQDLADRSGLVGGVTATNDPRIVAMQQQGTLGLYPMWERTQLDALATSYSNVFLILAALTFVGMILAFFLRSGPAPATGAGHAAVEVG